MRSIWLSLICAMALSGVAGACSGGGGGDDPGSGGTGGGNVGGSGGVGGVGGTGGEGGTGGSGGEGGTGGSGGEGGTGGSGGEGGTGGSGGEGGTGGSGGEGGSGGTGGEGGTGGTGGSEPEVIACPGSPLPPLPSGTCSVAPGSGVTVLIGDVLAPDQVFQGGQIVVDASGVIQCVACDCSATPGFTGATTVTCPNAAISPGLLNPHDHITYVNAHPYVGDDERYEHRHDWRKGKRGHTGIYDVGGNASVAEVQYGELRFVMGGATSVNGSGSAPGFLRNLDKSGDAQEGLGQKPVNYETFPLGDSGGQQLVAGCGYSFKDTEDSIAGDDSYTPHVSEGIDEVARNEFLCLSSTENGGHDLIQPQTAIIHGIGLKAADIAQLAMDGTSLIWSPRSNIVLYGDTARVTEYARQGVGIALGTDWIASGSMNMLRELQCADYLNQEFFDRYFSDADLWRMATLGAAEALAVDDVLGALAVGKVADIAVFADAPNAFHRAVIDADADDVVLVLRGGQVLYGDANLVPALPGGDNCDEIDVCGTTKQACVLRETGKTLAQLQGANQGAYPLFFCGQPDDEPSCHPARAPGNVEPNYTGVAVPNDGDGDGIPDISDNCPGIFNPIRPIDDGIQADHDLDFVGDACDPCPLAPNTETCPAPDPNDRDADGAPNASDNCPDVFNPEQDDGDGDGKGDPCDLCPEIANPGAAACPVTISAVKHGDVPEGTTVAVLGALVTGVHERGFFVQTDPADDFYAGPAYTGVYVYTNSAPTVAVGDRVDITSGTVTRYWGQIQLGSPVYTVTAHDQTLPPPAGVTPADVATGGPLAAAYEGVLVEVENVSVTDVNPPVGGGDSAPTYEFVIDGGLRVNDLFYRVTPFPVVGERFASITGVLELRNDHMKIEPRSAADFVASALSLLDFGPASSWARVNDPVGPTFPEPLTASVARAAAADTGIALVSGDPAVAWVPATVTLPAGQTAVAIPVTALSPGTATITASLGGVDLTAEVVVLASDALPTAMAVSPAAPTVTAGSTTSFTVSLDLPAPAAGLEVAIVVTGSGNAPGTVTIPGNGLSADFDFLAGGEGTARITVTAGDLFAEADVTITAAPQGALVINEVDYDQPSTDTTEFVEIWNGTGAAIDLAGYDLVLVNGSNNREYNRIALQGVLPADGYLVLGTSLVTPAAGALFIALPAASDNVQNGEPDGLALVRGSTVIDTLSYEGSITAATIAGITGTVNLVKGSATSAADRGDGSLCRVSDTGDDATDWAFCATVTPGAANQR